MDKAPKNKRTFIPTVNVEGFVDIILKPPDRVYAHVTAQALFHINRLEEFRSVLTFPMAPHRKTVSDFIFISQGRMRRRLGLTTYELAAGNFIFLPAHQISFDEWMSEDIQGFYCHFAPELLTKRWTQQELEQEFSFMRFFTYPIVSLDEEMLTNVLPLLNRLEGQYKQTKANAPDILQVYLLTLFTELKRGHYPQELLTESHPTHSAAVRLTQRYKQVLMQHIYEQQTVAEYARLFHVSPNHLNKCIKLTTGHSARSLLDEMILLEAKVLLRQSDLSISEIAHKIGKQEPGNFARFFRLKTGMSPTVYRQMD